MGQQQAPSVNSAFVTNSPPSFGPTFNASMPAGTLDLPTLNFDPREHFAKPELLGLNTFAAAYPPQQQPQQQPQPVTPQGQNYFGAQGVVNSVPTEVLEIPTLNFDDQRFGRPKQQSRDMVENNQADDGLLHLPQMTW
jgi:hypothetical protein